MEVENTNQSSHKLFRNLLLAAAILMYGVILMGGVVRSNAPAGNCPDWPTCYGSWLPPAQIDAVVDYLHRLATLLVTPLLLAVTVLAWRYYRRDRRISLPIFGAMGLTLVQIVLGGFLAVQEQHAGLTAVHLGLSLLVQGLLLVPLVVTFTLNRTSCRLEERRSEDASSRSGFLYRTPFARLSLITLAAAFVLLVSGAVVAGTQSSTACPAWPLCNRDFLPIDAAGWIHMTHRLAVAVTGILVAVLIVQAWLLQRSQTTILVSSTAAGVLFFAQALMGAYKITRGFPLFMIGLHEASAVAVWATMIVQAVAVGMAGRTVEEEEQDYRTTVGRKGLWKDFLMLTKPIVVALLLVTTFTGMVIGAKAWPSLSLVFWTLLGGALAAGGSGAINQYIDRFDDSRMQRTEKRPIPAGRLTPGEGLAFGVAISLVSFYLVTAYVNLLAALLVLAGIIYYVLIYSIFLKKNTVQNIVIGGGAGAIPPLVGWAAATGSLNVPALFLFALVFLWTPPHFWALALVRRNDYARAGVPMLPVVRGEKETRWQILLYTVELVVLTLLLPLFGLGRGLYLVSAAALGGWLLLSAWKVWRKGGNKTAWLMYRYSSMYLAFIFFALMVDRLIF